MCCGYFEAARSLGKRSRVANQIRAKRTTLFSFQFSLFTLKGADAKRAEQITLYTRKLKIVTNNIRRILAPTLRTLIRFHRLCRHIYCAANITYIATLIFLCKTKPITIVIYYCCWWVYSLAIYSVKIFTISECGISNRSYDIRDSYTCKAAAITECPISNRSYAIRNSYTCKTAATIECRLSNRSYAIWNSYTCKAGASLKCITSNCSYIIRNSYTC